MPMVFSVFVTTTRQNLKWVFRISKFAVLFAHVVCIISQCVLIYCWSFQLVNLCVQCRCSLARTHAVDLMAQGFGSRGAPWADEIVKGVVRNDRITPLTQAQPTARQRARRVRLGRRFRGRRCRRGAPRDCEPVGGCSWRRQSARLRRPASSG